MSSLSSFYLKSKQTNKQDKEEEKASKFQRISEVTMFSEVRVLSKPCRIGSCLVMNVRFKSSKNDLVVSTTKVGFLFSLWSKKN